MTPGARTQAAIDIIDRILGSWMSDKRIPADKLLENYFKTHRYIGSKDRGAISELVYWVLRHKAELEWHLEKLNQRLHGRTYIYSALALRREYQPSLHKDSQYSPPPLDPDETRLVEVLSRHPEHDNMQNHVRLNYPQWLEPQLKEIFGAEFEKAITALNEQAPTDLRVNTLKTTREQLQCDLEKEGFTSTPGKLSPLCLRLEKRAPIFTSPLFKAGHFEVQDEGSQLVALAADAKPGQRVIDFCSGAGGKTLVMAAEMKNKGRILAWDTSEKRLKQIVPRLRRAGVDNVQTHVITSEHDAFIKRHKGTADRVLVDAPCSGMGTWRRNPDLKWRFTQKDLDEVVALQQSILQSASRLVKPGGKLIYATCSLLKIENEAQIIHFLKNGNHFTVAAAEKIWDKNPAADTPHSPYMRLTPHQEGVDGFFAAVLVRQAENVNG